MSIQYRFVPIYDNLNEDSEKVQKSFRQTS